MMDTRLLRFFQNFKNIFIMIKHTKLTVTRLCYSLFIEEVKGLGFLCGELGEGATPLYQAARGVVFHVGLGLHLLYCWGAGGGAKQSAEAAGGEVTESQEGHRADRSAGEKQGGGGHQPTRQPRNYHQHLMYSDIKHAGSRGIAEYFLSLLIKYQWYRTAKLL